MSEAFQNICSTYFNSPSEITDKFIIKITDLLVPSQKDHSRDLTRGFNMLFGSLSKPLIDQIGTKLLETLISNSVPSGAHNDDAETRKYAIRSI